MLIQHVFCNFAEFRNAFHGFRVAPFGVSVLVFGAHFVAAMSGSFIPLIPCFIVVHLVRLVIHGSFGSVHLGPSVGGLALDEVGGGEVGGPVDTHRRGANKVLGRTGRGLAAILVLDGLGLGVGVGRALAAGVTITKLALALGVVREDVSIQVGFVIETGVGVDLEVLVGNNLHSFRAITGNAATRFRVADGTSSALLLADNAKLLLVGRFVVDAGLDSVGAGSNLLGNSTIGVNAFLGVGVKGFTLSSTFSGGRHGLVVYSREKKIKRPRFEVHNLNHSSFVKRIGGRSSWGAC